MAYDHTQLGTFLRIWLGGIVAICASITISLLVSGRWQGAGLFCGVTLFSGFIASISHNLTVRITSDSLQWSFGIGIIRKSIRLDDIQDSTIVKTRWYHGWGVKWYGRRWLYNVDGFDAVEINLRSGRQIRIGTDEPQMLRQAMMAA